MTSETSTNEANASAELEQFKDVQGRIDRVAEDIRSGQCRYAVLDALRLAELFDVSLDDWDTYFVYEYLESPDNNVSCHPFAENATLLEDHVSPERYEVLINLTEAIEEDPSKKDIALTEEEEKLLRAAYHLANNTGEGVTVYQKTVLATNGTELIFESTDSDAWSPYEVDKGEGFDPRDDFVPVDESLEGLLCKLRLEVNDIPPIHSL